MACNLSATQLAACESGIGKLNSPIELLKIIAQLSCEIADAGGGSSSAQLLSGSGAPVAAPADPASPAIYYDDDSGSPSYGITWAWDTNLSVWIGA